MVGYVVVVAAAAQWGMVLLPTICDLCVVCISRPEWLKLDTSVCAFCVVHSVQPLPNYFGLLFLVILACIFLMLKDLH